MGAGPAWVEAGDALCGPDSNSNNGDVTGEVSVSSVVQNNDNCSRANMQRMQFGTLTPRDSPPASAWKRPDHDEARAHFSLACCGRADSEDPENLFVTCREACWQEQDAVPPFYAETPDGHIIQADFHTRRSSCSLTEEPTEQEDALCPRRRAEASAASATEPLDVNGVIDLDTMMDQEGTSLATPMVAPGRSRGGQEPPGQDQTLPHVEVDKTRASPPQNLLD
eukprot:TRINITY_DN6817_c0_g1_i1.p1 TRINITY_DN6817_c0_g1~~TRINITY_DN6817_c0_g1_i1.p1  ORF type:complete len:224 (+),score=51.07 TRINITY_DN6817_c0_g1_i1:148-819(+)